MFTNFRIHNSDILVALLFLYHPCFEVILISMSYRTVSLDYNGLYRNLNYFD